MSVNAYLPFIIPFKVKQTNHVWCNLIIQSTGTNIRRIGNDKSNGLPWPKSASNKLEKRIISFAMIFTLMLFFTSTKSTIGNRNQYVYQQNWFANRHLDMNSKLTTRKNHQNTPIQIHLFFDQHMVKMITLCGQLPDYNIKSTKCIFNPSHHHHHFV